MSGSDWHISSDATQDGLAKAGEPFFTTISHGTMRLMAFAPRGVDLQGAHTQDELYLVSRGSSGFVRGSECVSIETGDAVFVPAGMEHRFEDMSDDFEAWVIFWGVKGGES